jgi:LmbE family N-acetylglucosaminyl deacetylase
MAGVGLGDVRRSTDWSACGSVRVNHDEGLDVIAVGAHPDDVEIACGGTLAALVRQGYRVGIVDLTDGEPTPLSPNVEARLAEAESAREVLGVHRRLILTLPNRRLFDSFEARVALAREFRRFRPSLVIGFGEKTPMASPDHWQAMQITDAAVFYSRLTKWEQYFDDLPPHKIDHQLYFQLAIDPAAGRSAAHPITVDISDTLAVKLQAVRCYRTQFPEEKASVFQRIEAAAVGHGLAAGFRAGECFASVRPFGTRNLMATLGRSAPSG